VKRIAYFRFLPETGNLKYPNNPVYLVYLKKIKIESNHLYFLGKKGIWGLLTRVSLVWMVAIYIFLTCVKYWMLDTGCWILNTGLR